MKKIIKSAVSIAIPLSMFLFGSVTASAAPTDTTEEIIADETESASAVTTTTTAAVSSEISETGSAEITSVPEGAVPESTATSALVTEAVTTTTVLENPYEDGMLADDELFQFINEFLNDGVSFDVDGSGVLIGEDILNPEVGEDYDETEPDGESGNEATENKSGYLSNYYSGEKLMYTVATRDGNIFYIIIDKSGVGENVYFLNSVDFTDLAALVDTEKETLSKAEKDILQAANESTGSESNDEGEDNEDENSDSSVGNSSSDDTYTPTTSSGGNNTMYIVLAVVAIGVIGVAAYFKVGPGKKKMAAKAAFDDGEDDEDDESDDEEEYYVEDENEEPQEQNTEQPQEDSYEESYEEE